MWLALWNDPMCLKLVNCLLSAGSVCLLYRLVLPHVRPAAARTAALCLAVFPTAASGKPWAKMRLRRNMACGFFLHGL